MADYEQDEQSEAEDLYASDEHILAEAKAFLVRAAEVESENRSKGLEDVRFSALGEQWPAEIQNSRQLEQRPMLTINKVDSYCRQVENQQRQQRPRMQVQAVNSIAQKKIAEVIQGMLRHIELISNADHAYDTAFWWQIRLGWGFWRIRADYLRPDSFDQDLFIDSIDNPLTVYIDPNSVEPDGSDMNCCMITTLMDKEIFKAEYPNCDDGASFTQRGTGDANKEWVTKDQIRIAEYYERIRVPSKLYKLSDGSSVFEDKLPHADTLAAMGVKIVDERDSFQCKIMWWKMTGMEILDRRELPGRYIPVVPAYGNIVNVEGKRKKFGLVRFAKDPQRMVNYWETAATESMALAPKAKWLLAEGQDEGHENEWASANVSAKPYLRYKQTDIDGQPAPPPQRLQPEPPPAGILEEINIATQNLREVLGISDPAQRIDGNVSGKALISEKQQSDNATFHYYDNLTRSMRHTGRIILDLLPYYYNTERELRILGDDGKPTIVTINGRQTSAEQEVMDNNVTIGEYDIVMDTGPGYNSKRQEAVAMMTPLMGNQQLMQVAGDLFFRNSDFPGAEVIADRLAAVNPLADIDESSDVPPRAQMMIKTLQKQLQDQGEQLQQLGIVLKSRSDVEKMRQDGETQREHMRSITKVHDTNIWSQENLDQTAMTDATKRHDTETRARTQMDIEEYRGMVALMLKKLDGIQPQGNAGRTETPKRSHPKFPGFQIREVIHA